MKRLLASTLSACMALTAGQALAAMPTKQLSATAASDPTSLPAYRAIAEHLMKQDKTPLLGAEWKIEDIAGGGVIDNSPASLQFMADGKLAGNGTCNRFFGSYSSQGAELKIEPLGATMMACPEALMNQEQKLLGLLAKVKSYAIDDTGALLLTTTDGNTILARR